MCFNRHDTDDEKVTINGFISSKDLDDMVNAMLLTIELMQSPPMRQFSPQFLSVPIPGCEHLPPNSKQYLRCAAQAFTVTFWHFSGTARMGHRNNSYSVVDPDLKVSFLI